MTSDVLGRSSLGALRDCLLVVDLLLRSEFAFGMREEIGAVAAQGKHEQRLGVQARRTYVGGGELLDGGRQCVFQWHSTISTQKS